MTNQFHKENDHGKAFALLFHSHNIEEKFKQKVKNFSYTVIKDKEENRLHAMLTSVGEIGAKLIQLQASAITAVAIASSPFEQAMMETGLMEIKPSGVGICRTCLANAILTCEENLEILKDIQEATKQYATNL